MDQTPLRNTSFSELPTLRGKLGRWLRGISFWHVVVGYLVALTLAELLTTLVEPRLGMVLHGVLLVVIFFLAIVYRDTRQAAFLYAMALAPLIRLMSLSLPLPRFPLIYWYALVGLPLILAGFFAMRINHLTPSQVGFKMRRPFVQFLIALCGIGLGAIEYMILEPDPMVPEFTLSAVILPAIVLLVFTGFLEEFIFRGLMQETAFENFGWLGIVYVSGVFAALHVGYKSFIDVVFVFSVAMFFAVMAKTTGSIWGVTVAHGLTNIGLFLVFPFLIGGQLLNSPIADARQAISANLPSTENIISAFGVFTHPGQASAALPPAEEAALEGPAWVASPTPTFTVQASPLATSTPQVSLLATATPQASLLATATTQASFHATATPQVSFDATATLPGASSPATSWLGPGASAEEVTPTDPDATERPFLAATVTPAPTLLVSRTPIPTTPRTSTPVPTATRTSSITTPTATRTANIPNTPTPSPTPIGTLFVRVTAPPSFGDVVLISRGIFRMGCDLDKKLENCQPDETPLRSVSLDDFWIDRKEVTNAQYTACVAAGVCRPPILRNSATHTTYFTDPQFADYPVIYVTWEDANTYCTWVGKRLPTEAEWEKAARQGKQALIFPWGDRRPDCTKANYKGDGGACVGDTTQVGSYPFGESSAGLLDLSGNVAEWVADWYSISYYGRSPAFNPSGPETGTYKVARGGSWYSPWSDIRVANRLHYQPTTASGFIGFRCAASPEKE